MSSVAVARTATRVATLHELGLEALEGRGAAPHERELPVQVDRGVGEQPRALRGVAAAGPPALADRPPRALGLGPVPELREGQAEELSHVQELAQALDRRVVVEAVLAVGATAVREQAELLVVPDEAGRRARPSGELADPELLAGVGRGLGEGRRRDSDVHVNVSLACGRSSSRLPSCARPRPLTAVLAAPHAAPTRVGDGEVMHAVPDPARPSLEPARERSRGPSGIWTNGGARPFMTACTAVSGSVSGHDDCSGRAAVIARAESPA